MAPSLSDVAVPYMYTEHYDERGRPYYANHANQSTSWIHPGKFKALQDVGIVPVPPGLPDFVGNLDADDYPVPSPWERKKDGDSTRRVYYANHKTKTTQWRHPGAMELAQNGGREVAVWNFASPRSRKTRELEESYTSKGKLPPWIVQEMTVPPAGSDLEPEPFWTNYQTGIVMTTSPFDALMGRRAVAAARAKELPTNRRPLTKL